MFKFRVWDKEGKKFVQGSGDYSSPPFINMNGQLSEPLGPIQNFNRYIVQFFTGAVDETGKEIYQGDIIEERREVGDDDPNSYATHLVKYIHEVYWDHGYKGFRLRSLNQKHNSTSFFPQATHLFNWKVIGHIYDGIDHK